jgi:hypothetical protein
MDGLPLMLFFAEALKNFFVTPLSNSRASYGKRCLLGNSLRNWDGLSKKQLNY